MKITVTKDDGSIVEFSEVIAPLVPEVQGTSLEDLQKAGIEPVVEPTVEAQITSPTE